MKNRNPLKGLSIYTFLVIFGIFFIPSLFNKSFAQAKPSTSPYTTLLQEADKALAAKDYANALFLYDKASHAKPDLKYAPGKIAEINSLLDADTRAQLFETIILKAENLFKQNNYLQAKTEYQKALLLDPESQFPKDRLAEIRTRYTDPDDQAFFDGAVADGDKALSAADFDKAVSLYEKALTVKPESKSVKDKITLTRKQQEEARTKAELTAKYITAGDKLLQSGKRPEARAEYQKALDLTPSSTLAKQKLQEIDNYANNVKAQQEAYEKAIEQADQYYISRDFTSARLKYEEALKAKPEARYPKEMLGKTKTGESQLQSDQQKYDAVLASAENFLKTNDLEAALGGFRSASELKPAESYPKNKIAEIEALQNKRVQGKQAYETAIKNGDLALAEKKYDAALMAYREALSIDATEKYPTEKINEITALVAQQKLLDDDYKKSLAEADKLFGTLKYAEAIAAYTRCLELKPGETYPEQRIAEAQTKLSTARDKEQNYAAAVAAGDKMMAEQKYDEALAYYKQALVLKPAEKYPKDKTTEINQAQAKQKANSDKYALAISNGEKAFASGNYALALSVFKEASVLKPTEQYPKDKITEISSLTADLQKRNEAYKTAVSSGDKLFAARDYDGAKTAFAEAAELKKDEKYPKDQIAKINNILEGQRSADESYNLAVAEGNLNFNNRKYSEAIVSYKKALALKPAEAYPKAQTDKINQLLADQKKQETAYLTLLASADKSFSTGKYTDAISDYKKALEIKPTEKYPAEKIAESEKQMAGIAAKQENYAAAISKADALIGEQKYEEALSYYQQALVLKPAEKYPKDKTTEINQALAKQKATSDKYAQAISNGDKAQASGNYTMALAAYNEASGIKPGEHYPKDKVAEITAIEATRKKTDDAYKAAVASGDQLFAARQYEQAKTAYNEAAGLKNNEKYPRDQVVKIDNIINTMRQADENYKQRIAEAEANFGNRKYTEALASYQAASVLKPAEAYPKTQIDKINQLLAEQKKQDEQFLSYVTAADRLFESANYTEAITTYRKALELKPAEKYPSEKITESEKQIADVQARQETYNIAIAEGEKRLEAKEYENALAAYKKANATMPAEKMPVQKIAEIQLILDKIKAENERYAQAIANGDKFYTTEKYREALEPYQTATTIKPDEKYPQEQITLINQKLADLKKLDDDYQLLITEALSMMGAGKYDEAKNSFNKALVLKQGEKLPKDKLSEIEGILAALQLKEENYSRTMQSATALYSSNDLAGAVKMYRDALLIKPGEKIPQERIAAIESEIKAIDEKYNNAVALGDANLASKKLMDATNAYQAALEIKPAENYPKTRIAEINAALTAQKEEMDRMYNTYISEADKLAADKDYAGAKSAYTKAAGIKPAEAYPKQRIAEVTKINEEIELARRAEYTKALGEADKLYNTKIFDLAIDAYDAASLINPNDTYPAQQVSKIRKYMADHAIQDLFSQTLEVKEGNEKKFSFGVIEPRLRKNNYILLKARSTGKTAPKVYLNYGKDGQKNGGIVLRSLDKTSVNDYLIRISVQDKWYREDNNWISLFVETGDIEISKVQIAAGD